MLARWKKNQENICKMNNGKKLFLDDYRFPIDCASYMYRRGVDCKIYHQEWDIVRTYKQFVDWIKSNGLPKLISFDHDLADVEELKDGSETQKFTGMDCAKWLVEYCIDNNEPLPEYAIHSANPAGVENIQGLLESFNKQRNV